MTSAVVIPFRTRGTYDRLRTNYARRLWLELHADRSFSLASSRWIAETLDYVEMRLSAAGKDDLRKVRGGL